MLMTIFIHDNKWLLESTAFNNFHFQGDLLSNDNSNLFDKPCLVNDVSEQDR